MVHRPETVRSLLLTDQEIDIFHAVVSMQASGMTSACLADIRDISIQHASTKLKQLREKGYLQRINKGADSGGVEYTYLSAL